jgi:hypothetical protein
MTKSKSEDESNGPNLSVSKSVALYMPNLLFLEKQYALGNSISQTVRDALDFFEEYLESKKEK